MPLALASSCRVLMPGVVTKSFSSPRGSLGQAPAVEPASSRMFPRA